MVNLFRIGNKIVNLDHVAVVHYTPAYGDLQENLPSELAICMESDNVVDETFVGNEADEAWGRLRAIADATMKSLTGDDDDFTTLLNPVEGSRDDDMEDDLEAMNQKLGREPSGDNFPHITEGGYPA